MVHRYYIINEKETKMKITMTGVKMDWKEIMKQVAVVLILIILPIGLFSFLTYRFLHINSVVVAPLIMVDQASTPENAKLNLKKSIEGLEKLGLTEGNTSILISYPKNDLSYFYKNIKDAHNRLEQLPANASELEKSKAMEGIRATTSLDAIPSYMHVYPFTFFGLILHVISGILTLLFLLLLLLFIYI